MKTLAIVICNYNKKDDLKECLNSIEVCDLNGLPHDIIIVDNASEDGSQTMIKKYYSDKVILIENSENTGGAGGFGLGLEYTQDKVYEYICLLDNDTKVHKDTFKILQKHLKENSNVGVVGATILHMDKPNIVQEMGANIKEFDISLNYPMETVENLPNELKCDYVPACCLMAKLEAVKKVGTFQKELFIYWDDIDWCKRITNAGYDIYALKEALVWHKGTHKTNTLNTFNLYYGYRNKIRYFLKYLDEYRLDEYMDYIGNLFKRMIFFSSIKNRPNATLSILLAFEDLCTYKMGKQDKRILIKEQNKDNPFEKIIDEVVYFVFDEPNQTKIIDYLKEFFKEVKIIKKEELSFEEHQNECIVFYKEDMLSDTILEKEYNKLFFIDDYYTFFDYEELKEVQIAYKYFNMIFSKIDMPIFIEKCYDIRKRLIDEK